MDGCQNRPAPFAKRSQINTGGIGEHHAFIRKAVNVGRFEAHQTVRVGADVGLPDVVAPDDDDVWSLL
jgi:hypothetical protein